MRKTAVLLIALLCLALPGCTKTASTQEEMVALARPHLPIAEIEAATLRAVGQANREGMSLLILAVGEGEDTAYFPVSFSRSGSGYAFSALEEGELTRRAPGCYSYRWQNGLVLLVDNPSCVRVERSEGTKGTTRTSNSFDTTPKIIFDAEAFSATDGGGSEPPYRCRFFDAQGQELQ